ncbi:hypothetical protein HAP94_07310 [Acidithiobacillus ferrivorans]|nr:hypothetical protein [Acidithiobacillus ferrivorans]
MIGKVRVCRWRWVPEGAPNGIAPGSASRSGTRWTPLAKQHHGFQTGDMVRAEVAKGVHKGIHVGRVAVRSSGSFKMRTKTGLRDGVKAEDCRLIQRSDGYSYFRELVS